ncbi:MAG TPA: hypothetical protein VJV74_02500 [Terriglobia bacterium]|nr:hypothetical protein [Terriglobia bacterium]
MAITKPDISPAWGELTPETLTGDLVRPTDAFIRAGWPLTSANPARGFFNWVLKMAHMGVRYLMQWGIVDWDTNETYAPGAIVRDTYTENGFQRQSYFQAVGTPGATAPHADTTNWAIILELPIAQSTNYLREIMSWRNSNGKRRFVINHLGFPAGKLLRLTEDWASNVDPLTASSPGTGTLKTRWLTTVLGTGATMALTGPSSVALPQSASLVQTMASGATFPQTAHIESAPISLNDGADSFSWQCDAGTLDATFWDHNEVILGIQGATSQGSNLSWNSIGSALGITFSKVPGSPNWNAYAKDSVAGVTSVDTGVAADGAIHSFAIDYQGVGDGGTARAVFFIDGVQRATIVKAFTAGTMHWSEFCHTVHDSNGNGGSFLQGVVDWVSALRGGADVVR